MKKGENPKPQIPPKFTKHRLTDGAAGLQAGQLLLRLHLRVSVEVGVEATEVRDVALVLVVLLLVGAGDAERLLAAAAEEPQLLSVSGAQLDELVDLHQLVARLAPEHERLELLVQNGACERKIAKYLRHSSLS